MSISSNGTAGPTSLTALGESLHSTMADHHREPSRNLQDLAYYEEHFVAECKKEAVDVKRRVALLPEAQVWFDENGERRIEKMRKEGVEFKMWHF